MLNVIMGIALITCSLSLLYVLLTISRDARRAKKKYEASLDKLREAIRKDPDRRHYG